MALLLLLLAADGVTLHLEVDRTSVYAGEHLSLEGTARAGTKSVLPDTFDLAIRGPDGTEHRQRIDRHGFDEVAAGDARRILAMQLRVDPPHGEWKPHPPPLRDEGEWAAWLVMGDVRSNEARWTVRALGPDVIRREPTAAQREAVQRFWARAPAEGDNALLAAALLEAPNEGLAQHVLDVVAKGQSTAAAGLVQFLVDRAASAPTGFSSELRYGIDGPYLPRLGRLVLEAFEAKEKGGVVNAEYLRGIDAAIAWIHFHPEEKEARARLVALATKSSRLVEGPAMGGMKVMMGAGPLSPVEAWRALLQVGELRPGMTVDEAIAILGEPNHRVVPNAGRIAWYLDTPRHVNPGLAARVEGGRIVEFRTYMG